jgi:uncharacterized protein YdeI (YjbR/CyaY-like superfamily)
MKPHDMTPTFFATPGDFRVWLDQHHLTACELVVGFHKKDSGRPSLTWPESVDEALCVGWIDGVRRRLDETSYTIRFTPRRDGSTWSAINIARVAVLTREGRVRPAGRAAFAKRTARKSAVYSYEQRHRAKLAPADAKRFRADQKAWAFFGAQAPSYRQLAIYWIVSAKKPETRLLRLTRLIRESAAGRRIR